MRDIRSFQEDESLDCNILDYDNRSFEGICYRHLQGTFDYWT